MSTEKYVTYLEFGAKGDGVSDDFAAICAAHEYANKNNIPVVIDDGRTYLIRETLVDGMVRTATMKTDVVWGSARIIIDDTDVDYFDGSGRSKSPIFKVESDYEAFDITDSSVLDALSGIGEGTKKVALSLGFDALLMIYNENHSVYHRYGASYISRGGQSSPQHEIILVDAEGNVDESTPFMFDYDTVTRVTVLRCDDKPITLHGGIFTTLASHANAYDYKNERRAVYYHRNIHINRSNTTLCGVEHYVKNEVPLSQFMEEKLHGAHYIGFYKAYCANEVTLKDCVFTGRTSYRFSTYEFYADHINKIRLDGCTQSNFTLLDEEGNTVYSMSPSKITEWPRCWGIGGTNFCKNMEYYNCKLSRFDAHQGLYNGKVVNSTINFMEIIGKGELLLDNVKWYSPAGRIYNSFAYLRDDYGCTWDGTITFKDCTMHPSSGDAYVFFYSYKNWDYGYKCFFPNLVIDNPTIIGLSDGAKIHVVNEYGSVKREPNMHRAQTLNSPQKNHKGEDDPENMTNANIVTPPSFIRIVNNNSGCEFYLPRCDFFENTEKVGVVLLDI